MKSKQPSWFTNKTERLYWEQWYVNLNVTQHLKHHSSKSHHTKLVVDPGGITLFMPLTFKNCKLLLLSLKFISWLFMFINIESGTEERSSRRAMVEASLREVLFQIIKFVNEKKDHVPPISEGVIYFPYEITIPRSALSSLYLLFSGYL